MDANGSCIKEPYNISSEEQPLTSAIITKGVFLTLAVAISFVFNTLCLVVLHKVRDRSLTHVTKIFLISFTLCDLFGIVFVHTPMTVSTFLNAWPFGDFLCDMNGLAGTIFAFTGGIQLLALNLERYLAIMYPLKYNIYVTPKRAKIAVVVLWVSAIGLAVLGIMLPGRYTTYSSQLGFCTSNPCGHGSDISGTILSSAFAFSPLFLTLFLWLKIYLVARRHARAIIAQAKSVNYSTPTPDRRYNLVNDGNAETITTLERKISPSQNPVEKEMARKASKASLASIVNLGGTLDRRKSSKCSQAEQSAINANRRAFFTFFLISLCMAVVSLPFTVIIFYDNITREMLPYNYIAVAEFLIVSFGFLNVIIYYVRNAAFRKTAIKLFKVSGDPFDAKPSRSQSAYSVNGRSTGLITRETRDQW